MKLLKYLSIIVAMYAVISWIDSNTPFVSYPKKILHVINDGGFSENFLHNISKENEWLMRYFNGPPSIKEVLVFFNDNKDNLNASVNMFRLFGGKFPAPDGMERPEFSEMKKSIGINIYSSFHVEGSKYMNTDEARNIISKYGRQFKYGAFTYYGDRMMDIFLNKYEDHLWRGHNGLWSTHLRYVPVLTDTELKKIKDPINIFDRGFNYIMNDNEETNDIVDYLNMHKPCAIKKIEDEWYIVLCVKISPSL